jgi:hypothetical protein
VGVIVGVIFIGTLLAYKISKSIERNTSILGGSGGIFSDRLECVELGRAIHFGSALS